MLLDYNKPAVTQKVRARLSLAHKYPSIRCLTHNICLSVHRESKRFGKQSVLFSFRNERFHSFPAFPWILCCQNVQKCCVNKLRSVQQQAHWSSLKIEKINTKSVLNCVYKWLGIVSYTYESGPRNSLRRREKEK